MPGGGSVAQRVLYNLVSMTVVSLLSSILKCIHALIHVFPPHFNSPSTNHFFISCQVSFAFLIPTLMLLMLHVPTTHVSTTYFRAQDLLTKVEVSAGQIGLVMNAKKTKVMAFNHDEEVKIITQDGSQLEVVQDFKYLGSWIASTEADVKTRKAEAWRACNKLKKIWKSDLSREIKTSLLGSAVESVLLYGSETWTLTEKLERQVNGCYTRLLRTALNIHWSQFLTNEQLYGNLPHAKLHS